ncbi:hypothetical protein DB32_007964 [Sandaracinus amylolyticus]|uniref:Uncharacterized protein n=1 Tax=Sandaracinus amylolyticus TaxID=927083 RepID=A0A0F6W9J1_9BACT|nr:hypothetical protein DB32_007964 [Sandaracinus amylolyticus]
MGMGTHELSRLHRAASESTRGANARHASCGAPARCVPLSLVSPARSSC